MRCFAKYAHPSALRTACTLPATQFRLEQACRCMSQARSASPQWHRGSALSDLDSGRLLPCGFSEHRPDQFARLLQPFPEGGVPERRMGILDSLASRVETSDTFRCPAGQTLWRKHFSKKDRAVSYTTRQKVCGSCALKGRCTLGPRRHVSRNLHENALQRMQQRTTPEVMRLRGSTVEHPFATIKYRIFGYPRFLLRGTCGAQSEISLATMVYNLKRMLNVLGGSSFREALAA